VGRLTESLAGIRVVKAYSAEEREHEIFKKKADYMLQKSIEITKGVAYLDLAVGVFIGLIGAIAMYFVGNAVMAGKMTVGDTLRYIVSLGALASLTMQAISITRGLNGTLAGLERINELLAEPREDEDPKRSIHVAEIKGIVTFESVNFEYCDNLPVLHNVNFRACPGMVTALVGPSGAGKSTIIGLIAGFYKPTTGAIRVDDIDLSHVVLDSYRRHLGIVPQDTFLFSGTIRDNIVFGRPDATDGEIRQACHLAQVDEFTNKLEKGDETIVGERGIRLSMGQRQRIALARAILANPKILILDEATSNLDSISEAAIQNALSYLLQDRTTFVIAHRLSTILRADQILVIDDGRVVECGTHKSLLKARGKYWQLYATQHKQRSNLFIVPDDDMTLPTVHFEDKSIN